MKLCKQWSTKNPRYSTILLTYKRYNAFPGLTSTCVVPFLSSPSLHPLLSKMASRSTAIQCPRLTFTTCSAGAQPRLPTLENSSPWEWSSLLIPFNQPRKQQIQSLRDMPSIFKKPGRKSLPTSITVESILDEPRCGCHYPSYSSPFRLNHPWVLSSDQHQSCFIETSRRTG
jgi:hypothetical protein